MIVPISLSHSTILERIMFGEDDDLVLTIQSARMNTSISRTNAQNPKCDATINCSRLYGVSHINGG